MAEGITTQPASVCGVLFPGDDAAEALGRSLQPPTGAVSSLSRSARRAFARDLSELAVGLVDLDLVQALVNGWQKHHELTAAARRTQRAPGSRETVRLATHRIVSRHEPTIDVLTGDALIARITLKLELTLEVAALEASVSRGRLLALHSGDVKVTAALAIAGVSLPSRSTQLRLPVEVPLGDGIPLCSEDDGWGPMERSA